MPKPEDGTNILLAEARRWRLPTDVTITPVGDLPEQVCRQIFGEGPVPAEGCCLQRENTRTLPKLINKNVATVLRLFDIGGAAYETVLASLAGTMKLPKEKVDEELRPLVKTLIHSNLLVEAEEGLEAAAPVKASLNPGDRWRDYVIEENVKIMIDSEIHRVAHITSGVVRILKITQAVFPNAEMKASMAERLQHEFSVLEKINHPYVVGVHGYGVHDGRVYGFLDYAEGSSVQSFLHADDRKPGDASVLKYALQCLEAVQAVHDAGYLHGDIHTGNFLMKNDHVCLIDFGLTRPIRIMEEDRRKYPEGGVIMYMPPESVTHSSEKRHNRFQGSVAGEVYSCAVILYLLFTQRYPYEWTTYRKDYVQRIRQQPPLSFAECERRPWPEMESVLRRALAKDPADRYASVHDFRLALQDIAVTAIPEGSPFNETAGAAPAEMRREQQ